MRIHGETISARQQPAEQRPAFIGTPLRPYEMADWERFIGMWLHQSRFLASGGPRSIPPYRDTTTRLDQARSRIITEARKANPEEAPNGYSAAISIDGDIFPRISLELAMSYLVADFEQYDVVVAPTVAGVGTWMVAPVDKENVKPGTPFEISAGGLGFFAMSPKFLQLVTPLPITAHSLDRKEPDEMYMDLAIGLGDDGSFIKYQREAGFKVGCDPRLLVAHAKPILLPPIPDDPILDQMR